MDPHLGVEFGFKKIVAVRGGLYNFQFIKNSDGGESLNMQPNIGIGLNIKNFHIDYAFSDIGDASVALYSHVISIRLLLDRPNNMQ